MTVLVIFSALEDGIFNSLLPEIMFSSLLLQIFISFQVGYMETLNFFIFALNDGILLELHQCSAGSATAISPIVFFLAM